RAFRRYRGGLEADFRMALRREVLRAEHLLLNFLDVLGRRSLGLDPSSAARFCGVDPERRGGDGDGNARGGQVRPVEANVGGPGGGQNTVVVPGGKAEHAALASDGYYIGLRGIEVQLQGSGLKREKGEADESHRGAP